jgi:hypothetical protein
MHLVVCLWEQLVQVGTPLLGSEGQLGASPSTEQRRKCSCLTKSHRPAPGFWPTGACES